jgi:hypothetical protein
LVPPGIDQQAASWHVALLLADRVVLAQTITQQQGKHAMKQLVAEEWLQQPPVTHDDAAGLRNVIQMRAE